MSDVARGIAATRSQAVAPVARRRRALPNGWWGVALLVATEATIFGTLLATYFYLRFQAVQWPPAGVPKPAVALPAALTAALVCTSVALVGATRSAGRANLRLTWSLTFVAFLVQCGYLAMQIHLFQDDLAKFSPKATSYGSIYFTLLGVHHAHVLVGIALELWLLARLLSGLTDYRVVGLRATALYWHFVNAMAVFVLLTQLSPAL